MAKTLKDLLLALLNATLILLALCLFLAWKVVSTADGLMASFAQNLEVVQPLRNEVSGLLTEVAGIREDLKSIELQPGEAGAYTLQSIKRRVDALDDRMSDAQSRMAALADRPEQLIDKTIETAADKIARSISDIRGCAPAS